MVDINKILQKGDYQAEAHPTGIAGHGWGHYNI